MAKKLSVEEEFKLLSQEEQILLRPDTMIGTIEPQSEDIWAFQDDTIQKQNLTYIPGFIKLFDEILTNASDHAQRGKGVTTIKVNIDDNWNITVWNDGDGIPVKKHKEHDMYIPEMILGKLNSGSNYNDNEERYGAGRNGVGSGCVALFSSKFIIDCSDGKKSYYQELTDNAFNKSEPIIKTSNKSYTSITYTTDFTRLPIQGIEEDTLKIIKKRIYDVAVYNPKIKVYFNDEPINIKSIKDWIELHTNNEIYYEDVNDKWAIGVTKSENGFEQCSIVNGNTTWQGGTHVNYIMNNIVNKLTEKLTKGKKFLKIRPSDIKNNMHLFLVCKVANPSFDTQTKVNLKTKITDNFDLSVKFYNDLLKSEIVESILDWIALKEQAQLKKVNNKAAGKTLRIPKLVDAHKAGTVSGHNATLCIAEGDSAASSVLAGFSEVDRNYWGVFPVKGRPLNVRDVPTSKIAANDEISNIMKILGLVPGKKYNDLTELRYGKVVFFTDSDPHGISIKGLLINMFHKLWPELLQLGFCYEFITPIVKATKGKNIIEYYDLDKYKKEKETKLQGYKIKYYKGLGTFMSIDMKKMFRDINKHLIQFTFDNKTDNSKIDLLFNKKKADLRKEWMTNYKGEIIPDKFGKPNPINKFFDNEFIQFANYDNVISIPDVMDGLKVSQRKILYSALKKNIKSEVKVAQFGASASELTHYNHGEANMFGTIINMAQDFIGSNNINIFAPVGQFGTRRDPKSSASPRYIYTHLTDIARLIFRKEDDDILNYLDEDGEQIEPEFYLPILPMILVNGTSGIGTGWSTDIPMFDPISLIQVIKRKLIKPDQKYMINPSYKNWIGDIEFIQDKNTYKTYGIFNSINKTTVHVTELPIGISIDKYINNLDKLIDDKKIKKFIDNSTDEKIDITITLDKIPPNIYDYLKLTNNISINNMHTWFNGQITKWETSEQLLNTWIDERVKYYSIRKQQWTEHLDTQFIRYANLFKFIDDVINGNIIVNNRKLQDILVDMEKMYDKYNDSYDYLLSLPTYAFTKEKYQNYKQQAIDTKKELKRYKSLNPQDIWNEELEELETYLDKNY